MAGLLGVLSSELSVFTLTVITLERHYAITHAMHLNKRLSLRHASYIMTVCWSLALLLSVLPLVGVSNYSKFAVCLPFETDDVVSLVYVVVLMAINGFAFTVLMGCYLKMYCSIRGSQAWNSNDTRIAKRMALLVFTDFICWAPIAFFALFALAGIPLLNTAGAKILTIFVLPFNSCANPFLYAIFTKKFKKDCLLMCKRIEESKVSRGIGRQKHSSNFSNRPTPNQYHSSTNAKSKAELNQSLAGVCECPSAVACNARPLLKDSSKAVRCKEVAIDENCNRGRNKWKLNKVLRFFCDPVNNEKDGTAKATRSAASHDEDCHQNLELQPRNNTSFKSDSHNEDFGRLNGGVPLKILCRNASSSESHEVVQENNYQRKTSQDSDISSCRYDSCSTSTYPMSRSSISSNDTLLSKRRSSSNSNVFLREKRGSEPSATVNNLMPPSTSRVDGLVAMKYKMRQTRMASSSEDETDILPRYRLCRQTAVDYNPAANQSVRSRSTDSATDVYCQCVPVSDDGDQSTEDGVSSVAYHHHHRQEDVIAEHEHENPDEFRNRPSASQCTVHSYLSVVPEINSNRAETPHTPHESGL